VSDRLGGLELDVIVRAGVFGRLELATDAIGSVPRTRKIPFSGGAREALCVKSVWEVRAELKIVLTDVWPLLCVPFVEDREAIIRLNQPCRFAGPVLPSLLVRVGGVSWSSCPCPECDSTLPSPLSLLKENETLRESRSNDTFRESGAGRVLLRLGGRLRLGPGVATGVVEERCVVGDLRPGLRSSLPSARLICSCVPM